MSKKVTSGNESKLEFSKLLKEYEKFSILLAKKAGGVLLKNITKRKKITYKLKTNFKIEIDDKVDSLLRSDIIKQYPGHNILSEESSAINNNSDWTWIFDPLDGTLNYTLGVSDHFAVSIALAYKKNPVVGVIYLPQRNELYTAAKGQGAFCNNKLISISPLTNINHSVIGIDYGKINRKKIIPFLNRMLEADGINYPVTYASSVTALTFVACGKIQGYAAYKLEPWDMAAAFILITEAGGMATTIKGSAWDINEESILAGPITIHKKLLAYLFK